MHSLVEVCKIRGNPRTCLFPAGGSADVSRASAASLACRKERGRLASVGGRGVGDRQVPALRLYSATDPLLLPPSPRSPLLAVHSLVRAVKGGRVTLFLPFVLMLCCSVGVVRLHNPLGKLPCCWGIGKRQGIKVAFLSLRVIPTLYQSVDPNYCIQNQMLYFIFSWP